MGYLVGKKGSLVSLREQEGLNRTSEQLQTMTKLFLEEPHTQGATGTWPLQLVGYSAIRVKKTPKLKSRVELPLLVQTQQCPTPPHPAGCSTTRAALYVCVLSRFLMGNAC